MEPIARSRFKPAGLTDPRGGKSNGPLMPLVEMELAQVVYRDTSDHHYIFLKEKGGGRRFPIVIGTFEASEIDRQVREKGTPRPLTHELLARTLAALGANVERIVVNDLRDQTFFAEVHVRRGGDAHRIDARPSDAIALAVRLHAPIFAEESVIESATIP